MNPKPAVYVVTGYLVVGPFIELKHAIHSPGSNGAVFRSQEVAGEPPHTHDRHTLHPLTLALSQTIVGSTASASGIMPANAGLPFPWAIRL